MEETSSPTDVSSSLSEFVRQEKILKEIYRESKEPEPSRSFEPLRYNDEEIDNILQQMGRLLSPVGQESDNKIYKHVVAETENKSIEQILIEAKELINDSMNPADCSSILSSDDVSSVNSTDDIITFINVEDSNDTDMANGNYADAHDCKKLLSRETPTLSNCDVMNGNVLPQKQKYAQSSTEFSCRRNFDLVDSKKLPQNKHEGFRKDLQILRDEVKRVNQLYESCKTESVNLRKEMARLEARVNLREGTIAQLYYECGKRIIYEKSCELIGGHEDLQTSQIPVDISQQYSARP